MKTQHAVAIADAGRDGEIRYLGEVDSAPATVERVIKKLASKYEKVRICYEAGPAGYGLYRQISLWAPDDQLTQLAAWRFPKEKPCQNIAYGFLAVGDRTQPADLDSTGRPRASKIHRFPSLISRHTFRIAS